MATKPEAFDTDQDDGANTTKHDRCRLMHLQLAKMFNDHSLVFQNQCVHYNEDGTPSNHFMPVSEMESIAQSCYDLNPSLDGRSHRDGEWIRKEMSQIRSTLTNIYDHFRRRGKQDAENLYEEWCKFSSSYPSVYTYSFCIIDRGMLGRLGRSLPREVQRDTGDLSDECRKRPLSTTPFTVNRRRQRRRRAELLRSNNSNTSSEKGGRTVNSINIQGILQGSREDRVLEFLCLHGSRDEIKQMSHDRLLLNWLG